MLLIKKNPSWDAIQRFVELALFLKKSIAHNTAFEFLQRPAVVLIRLQEHQLARAPARKGSAQERNCLRKASERKSSARRY